MNETKIKINVEGFGSMYAELYPEYAPKTVENFLSLVKARFFDGLIFHRVIEGFMIQGGGFDADFNHKEARSIKGEFAANGFTKNTLKHERGVLSMARTSVPDSASSQFFIMHKDAPYLDGQYAAFGKVTDGLDVIDKIAAVPTTTKMWMYQDCPKDDVVISSIEIVSE